MLPYNFYIKISQTTIIADAPARAFILGINYHGAINGCSFCRVKGVYFINHIIYRHINCIPRSDIDYQNFEESNQIKVSPLNGLISYINDVPPEYMHLVCNGATKKNCLIFFQQQKV